MGINPLGSSSGRGVRFAFLCLLAIALLVPALADGSELSPKLVDGSTPPQVPRVLRVYGKALRMTRFRAGRVRAFRALLSHCPEGRQAARRDPVVERVGYRGRSITFLPSRTSIAGCDRVPGARVFIGPWCGIAGWNFVNGRVSNPRLTVCYGSSNRAVAAFGWINPVRHARWIVVDQPGYKEVYRVAGVLPVRVSTESGIGRLGGATFRFAQYDDRGVLLVRKVVVAAIAS